MKNGCRSTSYNDAFWNHLPGCYRKVTPYTVTSISRFHCNTSLTPKAAITCQCGISSVQRRPLSKYSNFSSSNLIREVNLFWGAFTLYNNTNVYKCVLIVLTTMNFEFVGGM